MGDKVCSVDGCGRKIDAQGFCSKHYKRFRHHGTPDLIIREKGTGQISKKGYKAFTINGVTKFEHVMIAEKALGKPLPKDARVHHVDENPKNNNPSNLVICPNESYHQLLHQRMRALDACGYAHYKQCRFCKDWDDPVNMKSYQDGRGLRIYHTTCQHKHNSERHSLRKTQRMDTT